MRFLPLQSLAIITAISVLSYSMMPGRVQAAEHHVVGLAELQDQLRSASTVRAKNIDDIDRVLSLPAAQDLLAKAHLGVGQIKSAVAALDDQELARLAERARAAEKDVEGGLIVGFLALIGLIVVIIIVLAVVRE